MKVPVYDEPQVALQPLPAVEQRLNVQGAYGEASGAALQNVARGVEQGTTDISDAYHHEMAQLNAAAAAKAEVKLQSDINDTLVNPDNGITNVTGQEAFNRAYANGGYMARWSQTKNQLAQSLANDEQRRLFQMRSGGLIESGDRVVSGHLGQAAQVEKSNTASDTMLSGLQSIQIADPADLDMVNRQRARVESAVSGLATSPADFRLKMEKWDAQAANLVLKKLVDSKNPELIDRAERMMDVPYRMGDDGQTQTFSQVLGPERAEDLKKSILIAKDQQFALSTANQIVAGATDPASGLIKEDRIEEQLKTLNGDRRQAAVDHALNPLREQAERANKAIVNQHLDQAISVLNSTGSLSSVPPDTMQWLNTYAPQEWRKVLQEEKQNQRQSRVSDADERRAEAERQKTFVEDFLSRPVEERASLDYQKEYLGKGLNDVTLGRIGVLQRKAKDEMTKDSGMHAGEFDKDVDARAVASGLPKGPLQQKFKAAMNIWRTTYLEQHGNKQPTPQEVDKAASDMLVKDPSGHWFTSDKYHFVNALGGQQTPTAAAPATPVAPQQSATPPPKAVRSYRYTKDRTQRAPVFTDGTQGPLEAVNGQ